MNNPPPHPHPEAGPRGCRPGGCILGCFGVGVGIPLIAGIVIYILAFHSSVPLKIVAGGVNDSSPIELKGVGGSVSSGFTVEEVIFEESKIKGLTLRYSGLWDAIKNQHFVIEEFSASESEFVVGADWLDHTETRDDDTGVTSSGGSAAASDESLPFHFELRKLDIRDTRIRSADGAFDVSIPTIRLAGLSIKNDNFDLAELEVVSDFINLELVAATPVRIDGHYLPFSRMIRGSVLPGIHELVTKEIDFTLELAAVGSQTKGRLIAFGGTYEQVDLPDGGQRTILRDFTPADYLNCADLLPPERFNLTIHDQPASTIKEIDGGEFYLGKTRFEVPAQTQDEADPASGTVGHAEIGDLKITVRYPSNSTSWSPRAELTSEPEMTSHDLLSRIYFERAYEELDAAQKSRVDDLATALAGMRLKGS